MLLRRALLMLACALPLLAQKKPITIDTVIERGRAARASGGAPVWAPDGKRFAHLQGDRIMLYDIASKSEKELLALNDMAIAGVKGPFVPFSRWCCRIDQK